MNDLLKSAKGLGAAFGAAMLLGACSGGSMFAGGSDTQFQNAAATQAEIAEAAPSALPAIATECPPIKVRPGGEALLTFTRDSSGNPRALAYQAVIDQQSRNCVVSNGLITVNMGVVGRLLLGPAGQDTRSAEVPLRFVVERDGVPIYSQLYELPVSLTPPSQSEEFVKVVENVAIPYLGNEQITIWVGFDSTAS